MNRGIHTTLHVCLLAVVVGCTSEPATPPAPAETPPASSTPAPAPAPSPKSPTPLASEAELRAFVDTWLRAQNDGDFEAYAALYAQRFSGIKRAGNREYAFDRERWLADRGGMFRKPMVVEAEITRLHAQPAVATVDFIQRWSNDRYRDEGPKRLLLVREGDALRISREEMLRSTLQPRDPALKQLWFAQPGDDPWFVVGEPAAKAGPVPTPLQLDGGDGVYLVRHPQTQLASGPAAGSAVRVTFSSGQQCTGTLDRFARGVAVVPHFGTVQCWDDPECDGPRGEAARARALWQEGAPASPLAHVQLDAGQACEGSAVFARPASLPALRMGEAVALSAAQLEAMDARLRALPAFRKQSPACTRAEGGCRFDWTAFRFPDSDVVWTSGVLQPEGCGGDDAALWALWRSRPGAAPELARIAQGPTPGAVVQMLDVDGDGEPEFLVRDWLGVQWRIEDPKSGETQAEWGPEYHDCPC